MDDLGKKQTLILFAMWIAVFAMLAVVAIDQGIKKEILQRANAVRADLEKLEALTNVQKATGNAGRNSAPANHTPDQRSSNGSDSVDSSPAIVETGSANGTSRKSTKPGTGESTRANRQTGT